MTILLERKSYCFRCKKTLRRQLYCLSKYAVSFYSVPVELNKFTSHYIELTL